MAKKSYLYDEFNFTSAQALMPNAFLFFSFLPIFSFAQISGVVENGIAAQGMNGVSVILTTVGGSPIINITTSASNLPLLTAGGFSSISASGSCRANVTKIAAWTDGISTLDLVLISKHILGTQPFTNGFQWIAADANRNNTVTTADNTELRKLVLGIYTDLPKWNKPWQFIPGCVKNAPNNNFFSLGTPPALNTDGAADMSNVLGPKPGGGYEIYPKWLETTYDIPLSTNSANNQNGFFGVKIGDVNGNASFFAAQAGTRQDIAFNTEDNYLEEGKTYNLQISSKEVTQNLLGFQLGVKFDNSAVEIESVSSPLPEFDKNAYSLNNSEGVLRVLWFASNGKAQAIDENTFVTVKVKAKKSNVNLADVFQLDEETLALDFVSSNATESYPSLALKVQKEENTIDVKEIATVFPNPVNDLLTVNINTSNGAEVSIIDMSGRQILVNQMNIGTKSTTIDVSSLAAGAFICEIKTSDAITKKVIIKR